MMKRMHLLAAALAVASSISALAGPYDQPWVFFAPDAPSPTADTKSAPVMRVDGKGVSPGRSDPYAPGKHTLELSIPGPRGVSSPERQTLDIDAKPCTRYLFAAKRSSPTAKDWQAFVAAEEPIGECRKKFAGK